MNQEMQVKRKMQLPKYFKAADRRLITILLSEKIKAHGRDRKGMDARRDKAIIEFGWYSGLRVSGVHHLDVEDVCNPTTGEIKDKITVREKRVEREVPISPELREVIQYHLKTKRMAGEALTHRPETVPPLPEGEGKEGARIPFFCGPDGERLSYRSLQDVISRRCRQAGLTDVVDGRLLPKYSFHDLRHTFAVRWLSSHDNLSPAAAYTKLKLIMGHADIETTQKYALFDVREEEQAA